MRSRYHSLIPLVVTILILAIWTGCVEPISPDGPVDPDTVQLSLQVSVPGAGLVTKASVEADDAENALHDLRVWAFIHGGKDTDNAIAYDPNPKTSANGYTAQLSFKKSDIGLLGDSDDSVVAIDIYVLGNASSVGFTLGAGATRTQVRDAFISGDGPTGFGSACVESVPDGSVSGQGKGLPMSCVYENFDITFLRYGFTAEQLNAIKGKATAEETKGQPYSLSSLTGDNEKLSSVQKNYIEESLCPETGDPAAFPTWSELWSKLSPKIELTRAVSKVYFFFAKKASLTDDFMITRIDFLTGSGDDDGMIPDKSFLFPVAKESGVAVPDGVSHPILNWEYPLGMTADEPPAYKKVAAVENPLLLRWTGTETAKDYLATLNGSGASKQMVYLRESDRPLSGTLTYRRGESKVDLHASFAFSPPSCFPRNGVWIVYGYFVGESSDYLQIVAYVVDTEDHPWTEKLLLPSDLNNQIQVDGTNGKLDPNTLFNPDNVIELDELEETMTIEGKTVTIRTAEIKSGRAAVVQVLPFGPTGGQVSLYLDGNPGAFLIEPSAPQPINGKSMIFTIQNNPDVEPDNQVGMLTFFVELPGTDRIVSADSEFMDQYERYRFIRRK